MLDDMGRDSPASSVHGCNKHATVRDVKERGMTVLFCPFMNATNMQRFEMFASSVHGCNKHATVRRRGHDRSICPPRIPEKASVGVSIRDLQKGAKKKQDLLSRKKL